MTSIPRIVHQIETKLEDSNGRLDRHDLDLLQSRWNDLMEKINPFLNSKDKLRIGGSKTMRR